MPQTYKGRKRVVIAGFGDTGLLTAIHLNKNAADINIIGISTKACLLSGQELGTRLSQPQRWKKHYCTDFSRYKKLDGCEIIHGSVTAIDSDNNKLDISLSNGEKTQLDYDVLVISCGVSNGFWRTSKVENQAEIDAQIYSYSQQLTKANSAAIVGGGPSAVSVASNLKDNFPNKDVHLFYSQEQVLQGYHPKVQRHIEQKLHQQGVLLHPRHRAQIDPSTNTEQLTQGTLRFESGQADFHADITLWAVGNLHPNNEAIPQAMLNDAGFVKADSYLRVPGFNNIFTVGDIAASDPNRSSARNAGFLILARNIRAYLNNDEKAMKAFTATKYRWGSILGVQYSGMRIFTPKGANINLKRWFADAILFPWIVNKIIYRGLRKHNTQED